ncbi:MAG: hypothetical protein K0S01_100 [Herbinix sp.]|jgi:5-methylcytosine-specific restriction enzyme subunit McrC|nr:hypothetical protein [Herbinix sp.]
MILTILEYQKIFIGKNRNLSKNQITYEDADAIRIIDINNKGIFKWGNRYIIPQQWIGIISLAGLTIEILPKVSESYDIGVIKETLLYMFKTAHDIPIKKNVKAKVDFSKNGLIEILISNFLDKLESYIREGFITKYCKVTRNLSAIKGSLNFSKQISKNLFNPTRFICKYSRLEVDNDINQHIKFTLNRMVDISKDYSNNKRLKTSLNYFGDIKFIDDIDNKKFKLHINRLNVRIRELIDYCNLFQDGYSVNLSIGKNQVSSMLFDMNKVFEMFIYKSYKKIYGTVISYQNTKNYLITNNKSGTKYINLRPDILINVSKGIKIVVDTKWKVVKGFAKETDVYQINAYVTAIPDVDTSVLIYPKTHLTNSVIGDYEFINPLRIKVLKIRAVDLSLVNDEVLFMKHLNDILA